MIQCIIDTYILFIKTIITLLKFSLSSSVTSTLTGSILETCAAFYEVNKIKYIFYIRKSIRGRNRNIKKIPASRRENLPFEPKGPLCFVKNVKL